MGINYYRRGLTLNIANSCGITINNSINSTNKRHHIAGLPDYIINILRTVPLIFQNNFETSGKSGCYLQSDFSFPDIYYTSEEIRSLPEHLDRFKNVRPLSPVVSLENATEKKRNLNHDQNSHAQHNPSQISFNGSLEKTDEDNQALRNQSITLMLVDDDRDILFTFKSILAAEGFKVEAFTDPNEALSRFTQADPSYYNLVITDIRMPKINGFQLYQKLKEIKRDIRVLFMTAFEVPGNLLDSMPNINESDIIRKPIEEERFINKIKTAVNLE
jgi:CheY-like chemotaxis protein